MNKMKSNNNVNILLRSHTADKNYCFRGIPLINALTFATVLLDCMKFKVLYQCCNKYIIFKQFKFLYDISRPKALWIHSNINIYIKKTSQLHKYPDCFFQVCLIMEEISWINGISLIHD